MITIYVPDISCESCVKLISRALEKKEGITSFVFNHEAVDLNFDESKVKIGEIIDLIKALGFRASLNPFERKTFRERKKDFFENREKYKIERQAFANAAIALFILVILEGIAYIGFLEKIPNFISAYGWWLFYLDISIVSLGMGLWHFYAYETKVTCMSGMMVGMTFGMQTGMMIGAVMGAVNGFFIGSVAGLILGVIVGSLAGKCTGIMGVMEGMMAGVMGGTMGPMITVMMVDNILWFMPVFMAANIIIIFGLSYMLYEEVVEHKSVKEKPLDLNTFVGLCIIAVFILAAIMIIGPKSLLFR